MQSHTNHLQKDSYDHPRINYLNTTRIFLNTPDVNVRIIIDNVRSE